MPTDTTNYVNPNAALQIPSGVSSPQPISLSGMSSTASPYQMQQPADLPVPDVNKLASSFAPAAATPQEQKQSDLSTQLQDLNTQLSGKAGYQSDLYQQAGYGMTQDANGNLTPVDPGMADLNAKLTQITNNANAIPLQMQNNAEGRGITDAGLAPIQAAALRSNAIEALQVGSTIAARNGNFAHAQQLVDIAVQQKYGPIEAKYTALSKNLALIANDPQTSLQDKNRAQQQQLLLNQQQAQLDLAKTNYTTAQNEVLKYAGVASPSVLAAMQKATTPAQVAQIAAQAGLHTLSDQVSRGQLKLQQGQIAQLPLEAQLKQAQINSTNADVALKHAQASGFANPALITAVQNGLIDPTKVNSRTAPFYSALANAGVNANQLGIDAAATKKVITNLQVQSSQIAQAGGALESNMKLLASLSDKVNTLGIPAVDANLSQYMARYSNQPDVVNYLSTLNTVRAEYAKYIARGAQVDDSVRSEAASAIPVGINGATLTSLLGVIQTEGKNVQQSIKDAQKGQWEQLQGTSTVATQPTAQDGASHDYNGVTYVVKNGVWTPQ